MKYLYKFLFFFLLVPALSFAQSNFKPGYVVTLNGDTLHGFIDYKEWGQNPTKIYFKKDAGQAQKQQYGTNNLNAFEINGFENYRRAVTWVSLDAVGLSQLTHYVDSARKKDTIFLRTIYKGSAVSLYSYRDAVKERFYIAEKGDEPIELTFHRYLDPNPDHQSNILTRDGYKLQLYNLAVKYMAQISTITDEIQKTDYSEGDLIKMVSKINGDNDLKHNYAGRTGTRFFIGAALNSRQTAFNGDVAFSGEKFSSFFPKIDVGFDLYLNKNVGDWIFKTELSATGNQTKAHTINMEYSNLGGNYIDEESLNFKQFIVSVNPQLLYNFYNTKTIKIYVALGAAINYSTYTNKSYIAYYTYDNGTLSNPMQRDFPDVQSLFFTLTSKIGATLNDKLDIYAGYSPPATLNDDTNFTMSTASYQVGINYLFGKK